MRVLLRGALRTFRGDESGQSLIVIVSAMTVLLVIAAFAIDTANWMVRHHDAQVVADSAALAAAQCLAEPNQPASIDVNGTPQTLTPCSDSTDTQHAQDVAVAYAAANGVTISDSDVTFSGKVVTVKASTNTPTVFARVTGIGSASQTAQAGASWKANPGQCTTVGKNCDFMFAADTSCSSTSNGIQLAVSGSTGVTGNIQSNGNITVNDQDNGAKMGGGNFGAEAGCTYTATNPKFDPWSPDPSAQPTDSPFPIDYSKDFPACDVTADDPCQPKSGLRPGYPSFCTVAGTTITLGDGNNDDVPQSGNIYCASGTGTISDPSTWNGAITINVPKNQPNKQQPIYASFVGGTITFTGGANTVLSACGYAVAGFTASNCGSSVPAPTTTNYPVFYANCNSANCTVDPTTLSSDQCPSTTVLDVQGGGTANINGDMFAPNGTMCIPSSNGDLTMVTMIEALDIYATVGGNVTGDGPMATSTPDPSNGSISLVQ